LHIKAKKYAVHLSDEPRRCTFPMNCLYSTCRLTLIPDGWSANRKLARNRVLGYLSPGSIQHHYTSSNGLLDTEERLHVSEWRVQPGVANGSSDEKSSGGISYFCVASCEIRSTIWDLSVIYIVYIVPRSAASLGRCGE
jgi:hypothetical protein